MNTATTDTAITTWNLDPMHSAVGFSIRHLMITNVRGEFQTISGTVRFDPKHPESTQIEASIPVASISTRQEQRDAHLRGAELFDAEKYPTATFRSTRARSAGAGQVEVIGDLTLRGVTREITLAVADVTGEQKDHRGGTRMGATATAKIKRSDFGMTYNMVLEAGGVALADEVSLTIDVSLVKSAAA
jgi:polyisoprenoid-binding protein YceI